MLARALAWFWARSNNFHLGQKISGKIVARDMAKSETKAKVLSGYGWTLAGNLDQYSNIVDYMKQIVSIWHQMGNIDEEAVALSDMAFLHFGCGDDENGLKTARKAYELAQINNDPGVMIYCTLPVSQGLVHHKKLDESRSIANKIIELAEKYNNHFALFGGYHNLGDSNLMEGRYREAQKAYARGLKLATRFGDMHYVLTDLLGVAMATAGMGQHEKVIRLVGAANEGSRKAGTMSLENMQMTFWQELVQLHIVGTREKLGKEIALKLESEGQAMELEEAIRYAVDFDRDSTA
jgi:tetratricopeptide (TPR) repeat protein